MFNADQNLKSPESNTLLPQGDQIPQSQRIVSDPINLINTSKVLECGSQLDNSQLLPFDGADRSISKISQASGRSGLPPSGRNYSKKLSKENQVLQGLHSSQHAVANTENKSGIDFASPLPLYIDEGMQSQSIGGGQRKVKGNRNSQADLQRPFRAQKIDSQIRHSSAKRCNNKKTLPFGSSDSCTLMSAERIFNDSFAVSGRISENVTLDAKPAKEKKNKGEKQGKKKHAKRAHTFMPNISERNSNPLQLPQTMVQRSSIRAEAKHLAQAYLPDLNQASRNGKGSQVRKSQSRSPPADSMQGRRNRASKHISELEKQKNMQQSYRKLQISDGQQQYVIDNAIREKISPRNRSPQGDHQPHKSNQTRTSGTMKSQSSSTAANRRDIIFPSGQSILSNQSNPKKKNSQCNAKLPPILPQATASSLQNFNNQPVEEAARDHSPNSSPVKGQKSLMEDDYLRNPTSSQLNCSDYDVTVDQAAMVINEGINDYNQQNHNSKKAMQQKNGLQGQVQTREPKNKPPPMPKGANNFASPTSPRTEDQNEYENERKTDFEAKNLEKLRVMQEKRAAELKMIEDERSKAERRHKKLQAMILKEAAERKAKKAAMQDQASDELREGEQNINLKDVKKNVKNLNDSKMQEEEKTEEEMAIELEEKKKRDVMKKFYRNRYSSFLSTLAGKKNERQEEENARKEAEAKKKEKIRLKAIGDAAEIKSKFLEPRPQVPTIEEMAMIEAAAKPVLVVGNQVVKRRPLDRIEAQVPVESPGLGPATQSDMQKRQLRSSRSNRRSLSNSGMGQMNSIGKIYQNGKKSKRTGSRSSNRSKGGDTNGLPPLSIKKQSSSSKMTPILQRNRTLTPSASRKARDINTNAVVMSAEDQAAFDEKLEQEELAKAEERKKRAMQIRERNEKIMKGIQDKKDAQKAKEDEAAQKDQKVKQVARNAVLKHYEDLQNQPSLREQQDSRLQSKRNKDQSPEAVKIKHPPQKEMKPYNEEAIQNFCDRLVPKNQIFLNITDMAAWKKKYRVDEDTKVFIIKGGYPDVKKALKSRGWVENKDKDSPCFDLKWTLKTKDIPVNILRDDQIVNHFTTATSITTKVGLTHSLRNLIWFNNVDIDTFYPRCFDCGIQEELDDFIQEFKAVKACSYLKTYIREVRECYEALEADGNEQNATISAPSISKKVLATSIAVCTKRTRDLNDLIDDPNAFDQLVTDAEWNILGADEMNHDELQQKKHDYWMKKYDINKKSRQKKKRNKKMKKVSYEPAQMEKGFAGGRDLQQRQKLDELGEEEDYGYEDGEDEEDDEAKKAEDELDRKIANRIPDYIDTVKLLKQLVQMNPQFELDGERNIWIVKPAGSSRGRGIVLYKNLVEIMDVVSNKSNKTTDLLQWIVQKYIENPLIVMNRKFDLRQWVLITDWNPLTVWMYAEPYIRFPASDFTFENINNRYAHLSNNSVCKNANHVQTTHEIEGNMWNLNQLTDHLQEEFGYDVWEETIVDKIKNVVINTMESVQDMFECKKGQFELFGLDIMLDQDFNAWLIEVNSSPAMDYSTAVTERLVKMVLEDTIKVVVDHNLQTNPKKRAKVDTGLYECIYKAKRCVDKPMGSFGLNLEVKGKKVPEPHLNKI